MNLYSQSFFDEAYINHTATSAAEIVETLFGFIRPASVVDVGCGIGLFLAEFARHGLRDLRGIDGAWVEPGMLRIPSENFTPRDVSQPIEGEKTYDLAVSLEVGEHLPSQAAPVFVASLTRLSPVVLFSAAIPQQGGIGHLNEQWPEYWAGLFAQHGYVAIDCLRPRLWNNPHVLWWYAQNMVLFVAESGFEKYPALRNAHAATAGLPLARVHPAAFLFYRQRPPQPPPKLSFRNVLGSGKRWLLQSFRRPPTVPPPSPRRLLAHYT